MTSSPFEGGLSWSFAELTRAQKGRLPTESGVYVIKRVSRVMGLPITKDIVYVGRSSNLQRRFIEHINPHTEHNKRLLEMSWAYALEFWFATAKRAELVQLEAELIKRLKPLTNIAGVGERQ